MERAERRAMLLQEAKRIKDKELRALVENLLRDPVITFTQVTAKIPFEESPAAPKAHHSYPGGLIDHTIGVTRIARGIAESIGDLYGIEMNTDIITAAALLHDIFKYYQYERDPITGGFRAREDWYLAHDFALTAELTKRHAPEELIRACAEVHGVYGNSLEGKIVHIADSADAKIARELQDLVYSACIDIERDTDGKVLAIKTYYAIVQRVPLFALARIALKSGRDALREYIKRELKI